jgi:hypothetical protein
MGADRRFAGQSAKDLSKRQDGIASAARKHKKEHLIELVEIEAKHSKHAKK